MLQAAIVGSIPTHRNNMSPVAQSDRALNNETCKSLKQQISIGLLNQRSQVRALSGDFTKALTATL